MADTPGIVLLYEFDHVRNASVSGNLDIDQTEKNLCASLSLSLSLSPRSPPPLKLVKKQF